MRGAERFEFPEVGGYLSVQFVQPRHRCQAGERALVRQFVLHRHGLTDHRGDGTAVFLPRVGRHFFQQGGRQCAADRSGEDELHHAEVDGGNVSQQLGGGSIGLAQHGEQQRPQAPIDRCRRDLAEQLHQGGSVGKLEQLEKIALGHAAEVEAASGVIGIPVGDGIGEHRVGLGQIQALLVIGQKDKQRPLVAAESFKRRGHFLGQGKPEGCEGALALLAERRGFGCRRLFGYAAVPQVEGHLPGGGRWRCFARLLRSRLGGTPIGCDQAKRWSKGFPCILALGHRRRLVPSLDEHHLLLMEDHQLAVLEAVAGSAGTVRGRHGKQCGKLAPARQSSGALLRGNFLSPKRMFGTSLHPSC